MSMGGETVSDCASSRLASERSPLSSALGVRPRFPFQIDPVPIRTWSTRTIGWLWVAVLLFEALVFGPSLLARVAELRAARQAPPAPSRPLVLTPQDSADRAELLAKLRDSLGVALTVRGDTVVGARLLPAAQVWSDPLGRQLGEGLRVVSMLGGIIAALFLSPLLAVAGITVYWWFRRQAYVDRDRDA